MEETREIIKEMVKEFSKMLEAQSERMERMFSRRMEVLEHDLFQAKESNEDINKKYKTLEQENALLKDKITDLTAKIGYNRRDIINFKQEAYSTELLVISKKDKLEPPITENCAFVPQPNFHGGKYYFNVKCKTKSHKIKVLQKKKEYKDTTVIAPLCIEKRKILGELQKLKDNGHLERIWVHSDIIWVQGSSGDKVQVGSEYDLDYVKTNFSR